MRGEQHYAGFLPAEFLAGLSYQDREATWVDTLATHRPRTCNFVAETNEGEIVGFACGGPEAGRGSDLSRRTLPCLFVPALPTKRIGPAACCGRGATAIGGRFQIHDALGNKRKPFRPPLLCIC